MEAMEYFDYADYADGNVYKDKEEDYVSEMQDLQNYLTEHDPTYHRRRMLVKIEIHGLEYVKQKYGIKV